MTIQLPAHIYETAMVDYHGRIANVRSIFQSKAITVLGADNTRAIISFEAASKLKMGGNVPIGFLKPLSDEQIEILKNAKAPEALPDTTSRENHGKIIRVDLI